MIFQKFYDLLTDQISLSVCLYFLKYWTICVLQLFVSQADINFEVNPIFLTKPFFYVTKNSRQKFKYLENEEGFLNEIKSVFHHFYRVFICQKLSQTGSLPLTITPLNLLNEVSVIIDVTLIRFLT